MVDKWRKAVNKSKVFGILILNISKAFDCICNNVLIAKLNANRFSIPAVELMQDKFKTKIKGQKLVLHAVLEKELSLESHKAQSQEPIFSIITDAIYADLYFH